MAQSALRAREVKRVSRSREGTTRDPILLDKKGIRLGEKLLEDYVEDGANIGGEPWTQLGVSSKHPHSEGGEWIVYRNEPLKTIEKNQFRITETQEKSIGESWHAL